MEDELLIEKEEDLRSVRAIMDEIDRDTAEFYRDMEREIALLKVMGEEHVNNN